MKFYFSSGCIGDDGHLKRNNVKRILVSYFYLTESRIKRLPHVEDLLLDSGGFTAIKKGRSIDVKKYAQFINENNIKKAFTLDVTDLEESQYNLKYLETNTKAKIIPIYHPSEYESNKTLIKEYTKKYDYIGIGGLVNRHLSKKFKIEFLDYVFEHTKGIKIHGLGLCANMYITKYPFHSVDFTTWLNTRKYGCSVIPDYSKDQLLIRNKKIHPDKRLDEEIQYLLKKEISFK